MIINIGKEIDFAVDRAAIEKHPASVDHIWKIGLRNILMDSHASIKRDDYADNAEGKADWQEASRSMAGKKLTALMTGDVRTNAIVRLAKASPLEQEARRISRDVIMPKAKNTAQLDKWAKSFNLPNATTDDMKAVLLEAVKRYAAKPETLEKAQAVLDVKSSIVADDVELGL